MEFAQLGLPLDVLEAVQDRGWSSPTPIQALVIPPALQGSDILGGAPTGTGKTAAFLLPILARLSEKPQQPGVRALVLEPTRELAQQVCADANALCAALQKAAAAGTPRWDEEDAEDGAARAALDWSNFQAYTVIGGEGRDIQQAAGGCIVVATPGRLNEFIGKSVFKTDRVELLVIDEADRMLDLGFRDEVAAVVRAADKRYQTMLFSATLEGAGVRDFARQVLNDPYEVHLGSGDEDEKLPELLSSRAYYAATPQQKYNILGHLLRTAAGKAIVFVRTRERVGELCRFLRRQGVNAASLEGDMNITERKAALRRFKDNEVSILVATDVAARGLDISDVQQVYNFDLPARADIYVHRAGRTARAGSRGTVISLVERTELPLLERIERYTGREIEKRQIKNVCAAFPVEKTLPVKKTGRASLGGHGGFDRKHRDDKDEGKKKIKERWRDKKNKGKPDFAAKRARRAQRLAEKAQAQAQAQPEQPAQD